MTKKYKLLLFGGTFSPIHNAHLIIARSVAEQREMDRVVLIPNGIPPHKKISVDAMYKYEMIKLAIGVDWSFDTTTYEIDKRTKAYTIETVRRYKQCLKDSIDKPYWFIGPDNVDDLKNWYKIDELKKECIFIVGISALTTFAFQNVAEHCLKGFNIETVIIPHLDIRSTDIRERVSKGLSIKYLVPDAVEKYIKVNNLYSKPKL